MSRLDDIAEHHDECLHMVDGIGCTCRLEFCNALIATVRAADAWLDSHEEMMHFDWKKPGGVQRWQASRERWREKIESYRAQRSKLEP